VAWDHQDLAAQLEGIPAAAKSVLMHLAYPACKHCGLTWAGVGWIERKSGLGRTAIKDALQWLVREGHLQIHAYPHGGRGRSTEYVVLPRLIELSTPRCGECRLKQERGRQPAGIDDYGTAKEAASRPVLRKPAAGPPQNRPPGGHQSVIESQSVTRQVEPAAPATSDPTLPLSRAENARRARELANALGDQLGPQSRHTVKGGPSSVETDGHHDKAQGNGQDRETDGEV